MSTGGLRFWLASKCRFMYTKIWHWLSGTRKCVLPVVALMHTLQPVTDCWTSVAGAIVKSMLSLCFLLSSTSLIEYCHVGTQVASYVSPVWFSWGVNYWWSHLWHGALICSWVSKEINDQPKVSIVGHPVKIDILSCATLLHDKAQSLLYSSAHCNRSL